MTEDRWFDNTPGWILLYEEAFLEALARTLPENSAIVNIGSAVGTSSSAILRGVQHLDNAILYSVDIEDCPKEVETLKEQGLYDETRFMQVQMDSVEFSKKCQNELDMVFVDGSHNYKGTLADLETYAPLLKPGGLMVCHDYADPRQKEVTKAVDEWNQHWGWFFVGRVLYTLAYKKYGGGSEWHKGRLSYE